jgi:hypothetical protein
MCSLKGGPRTSALPRRFPADPPVLQGNDSLCPLRIIIEHAAWLVARIPTTARLQRRLSGLDIG